MNRVYGIGIKLCFFMSNIFMLLCWPWVKCRTRYLPGYIAILKNIEKNIYNQSIDMEIWKWLDVESTQFWTTNQLLAILVFIKSRMAGVLFEDIFDVKDINPEGKKFDRGMTVWQWVIDFWEKNYQFNVRRNRKCTLWHICDNILDVQFRFL